jgi:hypothetical protein
MIPKSGGRFSDKIMHQRNMRMIPKNMPSGFDPMGGGRFSDKIMHQLKMRIKIPS